MTAPAQVPYSHAFRPQRADVLYANDFGVAGDGTDQTTNLTRALNAAVTAGKTLVIPPGTYSVASVVVPANTKLIGYGPTSCLRRIGGGSDIALVIGGNDVSISDLRIEGNSAGGASSTAASLVEVSGNRATLRNLTLNDAPSRTVRVNHQDDTLIERCSVTASSDSTCITFVGSSSSSNRGYTVRDCYIDKSATADGAGIGVSLNQAGTNTLKAVQVVNNHVKGASGAICVELFVGSDDSVYDVVISGNNLQGGTMGISVPFCNNVAISGNEISLPATWGIEIVSATHVTCTGNAIRFAGGGSSGVGISTNSSQYTIVSGNMIWNALSTAAIITTATTTNPSHCIITSNLVHNCDIGVLVRGGAVAYLVANNLIETAASYCVQIGGLGGSFDVNVVGNILRNSPVGVRLEGATASPFTGMIVGNNMLTGITTKIQQVLSGGATIGELHRFANPGILPIVTGAKGGNAALTDLLAELDAMGVIDDQST